MPWISIQPHNSSLASNEIYASLILSFLLTPTQTQPFASAFDRCSVLLFFPTNRMYCLMAVSECVCLPPIIFHLSDEENLCARRYLVCVERPIRIDIDEREENLRRNVVHVWPNVDVRLYACGVHVPSFEHTQTITLEIIIASIQDVKVPQSAKIHSSKRHENGGERVECAVFV